MSARFEPCSVYDFQRLPVVGEKLESAGVGAALAIPCVTTTSATCSGVSAWASSAASGLEARRVLDRELGRRASLSLGLVQPCALERLGALTCQRPQKLTIVFVERAGLSELSAIRPIGRSCTCSETKAIASWPVATCSRANSGDVASAAAADSK